VLLRADGVGARSARALVAELLAMADAPTGFICGSESAALGAMAGIRDCGKEVGRDCDVVARVSSSLNDYLNPPLATCHLDIQEVARTMTDFLLRRIAGEPAGALQRVFDCSFNIPPHQKL
jgi:DNA-binding LacI/PurR family transcriptional regulator